jgi:hypothetical protein
MVRAALVAVCLAVATSASASAQTRPQTLPPPPPGVPPQPVGRTTAPPAETAPAPTRPAPVQPAGAPAAAAPTTPAGQAAQQPAATVAQPAGASTVAGEAPPTEQQLGVPIYPAARFLRSYDAGMGQRYYLFGATASYADLVAYYRTALRTRGDEVYDAPPVHMFEVGRFREQTMAFPPGVTVKDYTWGGAKGYLVPIPGAVPDRYPTIIQIVPVSPTDR